MLLLSESISAGDTPTSSHRDIAPILSDFIVEIEIPANLKYTLRESAWYRFLVTIGIITFFNLLLLPHTFSNLCVFCLLQFREKKLSALNFVIVDNDFNNSYVYNYFIELTMLKIYCHNLRISNFVGICTKARFIAAGLVLSPELVLKNPAAPSAGGSFGKGILPGCGSPNFSRIASCRLPLLSSGVNPQYANWEQNVHRSDLNV